MIANALLITIAFLLAYGFWLMGELKFMTSYKAVLLHAYGGWIFGSAAVLFFNVFGAVLLLQRKFLLKNTGRGTGEFLICRETHFRQNLRPSRTARSVVRQISFRPIPWSRPGRTAATS